MKIFEVDLQGYKAQLPIIPLPSGGKHCLFQLARQCATDGTLRKATCQNGY